MDRTCSNALAILSRVRSGGVNDMLRSFDHVVGEGVEEDGACLCCGDGWFPQLLEVMKDRKSELELLEVVSRWHELWRL